MSCAIKKMTLLILYILNIFCVFFNSEAKISIQQSLDGLNWTAKETEYWYEIPATVPGGIYTDLMNSNIIEDVFSSYQDNNTKWVGNVNWTFELNFTVNEELLKYNSINLVFDGVDTFSEIQLNDIKIGSTENMFIRYSFDVKNTLKQTENNTLKLFFQNAPEVGRTRNNEQLKKYKIPYECPPEDYHGECHINMLRKMQSSFGWDWGPSFPNQGIWKSVYLEAYDDVLINNLVIRVEEAPDDQYYVIIDLYFANNSNEQLTGLLTVEIYLENSETISVFDVNISSVMESGEFYKRVLIPVEKNHVKLWWPNGYGEQPLYKVIIAFRSSVDGSISRKTASIGFRFVELVQDPVEENGATFYFKINKVPIFIKGSNEIPINILPELGYNQKKIRNLLQAAKDVNMNMLRVWGGGVYESDYFYKVADELGIMIWQDFMFACSLYPATEEFLKNVEIEVSQNFKRIFSHPSVVIYAGNNENEGVLADNWYNTTENFAQYKKDYKLLYIELIDKTLRSITNGAVTFISSSPTNGKLSEYDGYVGRSPSNQFWGDVHYYNYFLNPWNSNTYPIPRFSSEFGYQSYPFEDSWLTATNNTKDLNISDNFINWRQHHPAGNAEIALLIAENLVLPNSTAENFNTAFMYLSQIYAAQSVKIETEHYRRYRSFLTEDGRGYTMGALYWQLNDVWVAPTWSSIDFTGRWKMLHYFAKNFFANIIVTGHINNNRELQLYTVNDQLTVVENVQVLLKIFNFSGAFKPVFQENLTLSLNSSASQLIKTIKTDDFLKELKCNENSCFFYFEIRKDSVKIGPDNYVFPGKLRNSNLKCAKVAVSAVQKIDNNLYEITVSSDKIAFFVWLDSHRIRGIFSENGFLMVEATKIIYFKSETEINVDEFLEALTVTHLQDIY